jgi:hypothetical protein
VGGGKFTAPVWTGSAYVTATINFKKGTVSASMEGGEIIVTAQSETMDKLIDSEAEFVVALLLLGYDGTVADLLDAFKHAVNYGFSEAGP